ncbi:MAG: hypothetical protein WCE21_04865 [Candidatus Babeliales bacterium]
MKFLSGLLGILCFSSISLNGLKPKAIHELKKIYMYNCKNPSDICEHLPALYALARECSSVVEIGVRSMVSTWALLYGLASNKSCSKKYIAIDLNYPPSDGLTKATQLAQNCGIHFEFLQANDMNIDVNNTELLFIDSLHTYCHLLYELEKFSPKATKYIALHDTSEPWGLINDCEYTGDYSEYPAHFDCTKNGLWPAVQDFLAKHPEWALHKRYLNCHGLTILKRIA